MINGKRVVALIPARGGSKSIPHKNIEILAGKPLIEWTIEVALETKEIDQIIVSTDCEKIANEAKKHDVIIQMRPPELAKDSSLVIDTIQHVINNLKETGDSAEYLVLLEPTAPLRSVQDIKECILTVEEKEYDSVATYTEAALNPHRAWTIEGNKSKYFIKEANPWLPRQELPKAYQLNGAVYVTKISKINKNSEGMVVGNSGAVIMPNERSVDIDRPIDLIVAEALINEKKDSFNNRNK